MTWILLLIFSQGFAQSMEQITVKKINLAREASQIAKIHADAEQIRIARLACHIQVKENAPPTACYQTVVLEEKFGLRADKRKIFTRLDRQCAIASRAVSRLSRINFASVSPECRREIQKARELLAYKLELPY